MASDLAEGIQPHIDIAGWIPHRHDALGNLTRALGELPTDVDLRQFDFACTLAGQPKLQEPEIEGYATVRFYEFCGVSCPLCIGVLVAQEHADSPPSRWHVALYECTGRPVPAGDELERLLNTIADHMRPA